MKKVWLAWVLVLSLLGACVPGPPEETMEEGFPFEELKTIDLYVTVMKAAYEVENGGNTFLAVKTDTLEGLSSEGKQEVLSRLGTISEDVHDFESVRKDPEKFETDEEGRLVRSIGGTLLGVRVEKRSKNKAMIEGLSWFGNLGAVFPTYEATWTNGAWQLKLVAMAVS